MSQLTKQERADMRAWTAQSRAINRRRSKLISTRVSWRAYCKERNIVRGEHTAFPDLEPTP